MANAVPVLAVSPRGSMYHRAKNEGDRKRLKRRLPRPRAHRVEQLLERPRLRI